ncbi:MAG: lysine 2,3-aminomutase [Ignavibacteriales bacterium]|nr:lysine 2,3-aminomutase [Ignavibacteriales bacterium]
MNSYKSYSLRNYDQIPRLGKLTRNEKKAIEIVGNVLPFKTNNYVIEQLIDWDNIPEDPIYTLTFPRKEMLLQHHYAKIEKMISANVEKEILDNAVYNIRLELNPHPDGQRYNLPTINGNQLNGIQHKYRETVLFFPSQGQTCHAYCTFCFRWPQFVGMNEIKFAMKETDLLVQYLIEHREVTDVLFTGGDPMIMKTQILSSYIEPLLDDELYNIQTIRIGTKSIGYWPYRFLTDDDADELMRLFEKIVKKGKNLAIMAHFNHPVELSTNAAADAIRRIRSTGAQIRTQSPVLKHINDKPEVWSEMWRKQVNLNCIPYYMFIARDTGAQHFFGIPLVSAWKIFREAYQKVSGVCRTVRGPSMSTTPGKIQVLGVGEVNQDKIIVMRFLQGRNPDWVARPFFAEYDENAIWFDELKPAFGKEKFFFEEELESIFNEHVYDDESENFE